MDKRTIAHGLTAEKFPEASYSLGRPSNMTDDECGSLWVYNDGRTCISCWKLTWRDRLIALLTGKIWLGVLSGRSQPPVWVTVGNTVFKKKNG